MKNSVTNWYRNVIRNPKYRWWIIAGTLVYLISPIDISPDFIPVIGWIDDGLIATILVSELSQVVLERLKGRKDNADAKTVDSTTQASTVDVNAVSAD